MNERRWTVVMRVGRVLALAVVLVAAWGAFAQEQRGGAATVPATQAAVTGGDIEAGELSFLQLLVKGGWFMLPIAAASLIGLALIFERLVALRKGRIVPRKFLRKLEQYGDDRDGALVFARQSDTAAGRVAAAGLERVPRGVEAAERAMEEVGTQEVHRLRKNVRMLYGVSAIAPLLGLLATVSGMIEAFRVTSVSKGLGRPELLAAGIYEALVGTMAGLMVAIPTLVFYYYCVSKIEQAVADLNDVARQVVRQFFEEREGGAERDRLAAPLAGRVE